MKRLSIVFAIGGLIALVPARARAQSSGDGKPQLHVSNAYSSCFFDLHPELTKAELEEFAGELGSILRFRQLGDTLPLPRGAIDVGVQSAGSRIDDLKGRVEQHDVASDRRSLSRSVNRVPENRRPLRGLDRLDVGGAQ